MDPEKHQIQPIDSLTPFLGGRWWIRARVTDKSDIRTWNKPNTQGKLFSFTLLDESASIRATVFNDAVDVFDPLIVSGQVYYFSGAQVKNADRRFSNVNNDYELMFDRTSDIRPCRMETSLPMNRFHFVPIKVLESRSPNSMVDVLAVVLSVQDVSSILQRSTGRELIKRNVKIADMTASVELTVWNDDAKTWSYREGDVLALSQVKTGSYNGVTLSTTFQTKILCNPPDIADARKLQDWYASTGGKSVNSLTSTNANPVMGEGYRGRKYFSEIQEEKIGCGGKPEYVDVRCVPIHMKQDGQWYDACPTCNKKVILDGASERSRCEKCDTTVVPTQRYVVSLQVTDNISQEWLTLFNETGEAFFGMPASELKERVEADPKFMTQLMQVRVNRPLLLRLRVVEEASTGMNNLQGTRLRMSVVRITEFIPIPGVTMEQQKQLSQNLKKECEDMLACIESY